MLYNKKKGDVMSKKFNNTLEDALVGYWKNYVGWGRAPRSEYWWCVLFYGFLASNILGLVSYGLSLIWFYATIVPGFCLVARRLHDTGRSNWNVCWMLLPIVGWIIMIIYLTQKGSTKTNAFGPARLKK